MSRTSFTVLFYIKRSKTSKDGNVPVYARITINGQRAEFILQLTVEDIHWDNKKGKVRGTSKKVSEINSYLDSVRVNLVMRKRQMEEASEFITASQLRDAYLGLDEDNLQFKQIFPPGGTGCDRKKRPEPAAVPAWGGVKLIKLLKKVV